MNSKTLQLIFVVFALHSLSRSALQTTQPRSETSRSLLHQINKLAYRGDRDSIRALLRDHEGDVSAAITAEERTPIHAALQGRQDSLSHQSVAHLQSSHEDVIAVLLESGLVNADQGCPLYYALHYRNMRALDLLLTYAHIEKSALCVTGVDTTGETALHTAVKSKASGFARLFAKLRHKNPDPRVFDLLGLHPLQVSDSLSARELNSVTTHRDIEMILTHWPSLNLSSVLDCSGNTLLHEAAYSGRTLLVDFLAQRLDVDARNNFGLTPLHLAYAGHHLDSVDVLLSHGAQNVVADNLETGFCFNSEFGYNCSDSEADIDEVRWIKYMESGWLSNSGYISPSTFAGCKIMTRYVKSEDDFISEFYGHYKPVVLRGLMNGWPAWDHWTKDNLISKYGDLEFTVSGVPYASLYGGEHTIKKVTLRDSIFSFNDTSPYPDYIFDGQILHRNAQLSKDAPPPLPAMNVSLKQFTVGPSGSGSSPHFHRHVLNALVYGVKRWFLWPPSQAVFEFRHVQDWYTDYSSGGGAEGGERWERGGEGGGVVECIQRPGDVVYVPENWGHAVVMDSMAYEFEWCYNTRA